jgi:hypothetical protein
MKKITFPTLVFLRIDNDSLDDARPFNTLRGAKFRFRSVASELAQYGQKCVATIHYARRRSELQEYPDYILELGPRGGVKQSRA